jgi:hypothetical protein
MLVGGMPQAVNTYIKTKNFKEVDTVKRGIINLYEKDFYNTPQNLDNTAKNLLSS